ncbi:hypothetical protein ACFQVC_30120 [Streptomyces monticola]|uniref:Uncharacterized protein n=1 Tax=Streptomyces monticola TaxID=2666263 RepID=A0ABW2JST2_9ACTN
MAIDTLGFQVDSTAEEQLRCIARAGGGRYGAVDDAEDLARELQDAFQRSWAPYALTGIETKGAASCAQAPLLPPGQYTDRISFREERWYKVALRPGQALRFSASVSVQSEYETPAVLRVTAYKPERRTSIWEHEVSVTQDWSHLISTGLQSDPLAAGSLPHGARQGHACVKVTGRINSVKETEPMELAVALVGRTRIDDGLPTPPPTTSATENAPSKSPHPRSAESDATISVSFGVWLWAVAGGLFLGVLARLFLNRRMRRRL